MNIVVIVGGSNVPSNSEFLADAFIDGARSVGANVEKILLRELRIDPFTIACYAPTFIDEPDVAMLRQKIGTADGLVIATPVWNFGIPGNLKNAIDRMGAFALDPERRMSGRWKDLPFFLIFTGGSPIAAWRGLIRSTTSGLRIALQYFGGAYVGTHFEPKCTPGKGRFELVVDGRPASIAEVRGKGVAFAQIVRHKSEKNVLPWTIVLRRRLYRIGQNIQRRFF